MHGLMDLGRQPIVAVSINGCESNLNKPRFDLSRNAQHSLCFVIGEAPAVPLLETRSLLVLSKRAFVLLFGLLTVLHFAGAVSSCEIKSDVDSRSR